MRGIDRRVKAGLDPVVHSVASIFIGRWDEAVAGREPRGLQESLGTAVAMQSYRSYREVLKSAQWLGLADRGAVAQRLLWATSGANAFASSHASVIRLAAPGTVTSMPEAALLTLAGQRLVSDALPPGGGDCEIVLERFAHGGLDTAKLAGQLQREGAAAFVKSWKDLLLCIESKAQAVPAGVGD
jgi:transaldolase